MLIFALPGQKCREIDMRRIYLLTTQHLEECLWFRDDEDFKVAMNYIAIQAACCPQVAVLAFILMSNHVHFVLRGRSEDVLEFVNHFKKRYSQYYRLKYGVKEFLRDNTVHVQEVTSEDEGVERTIAYVQMNPVVANICLNSSQYPWGTGNCFFNPGKPKGKCLSDISERGRKRLFRTNCDTIPLHWLINEDGYINPESYVDIESVESGYRSPGRMNFFLNASSKAKKKLEASEQNLPAFRDQVILPTLPDLCRSLFQKESFAALNSSEQSEMAKQIRYRFSADAHQIARVCGITYADAARLLDSA